MYTFNYDSKKNCIYVVVEGNMTMKDADDYVSKFKQAVDNAKPNFNLCIDLSKSAAVMPEVNERLNSSKDYAKQKGYKKYAFVVNSMIFKMQIKRVFHEEQESFFENISDAEKFLAS